MSLDFAKLRSIFQQAVERPPADWPALLDAACGADSELRRGVEQLLEAHAHGGSVLDNGPLATCDQPVTERPGTLIGPYKLLQQIGEGGMGVVFMAEQHEPVKRRVALKIIKPGMDTRQVIARFEAERQALSLMDHPNIARVVDAGTTNSGRPYFVMELVKGQPITQYCDEHQLTPRQRLELLLPVCQAIQHAHQKGIIHRDIKPTNILVAEYDNQPVPKVIDFGVAKATSQTLTEKTMFTGLGQIVGTLEYMSPEQAKVNQLDIDTRSDIYSLGVLLYELLTGSTPFDRQRLRSAAFDEMLRIIREEEPEKPSTRLECSRHTPCAVIHGIRSDCQNDGTRSVPTTLASIAALRQTEPAKLTRLVRGELDWIVMKALEKDRSRRYETANGFAADVQRYLDDEPVQACPPSAAYRFRKFARRNKRALASMAVLILAVLAVSGTLGWAVRDREARAQEAARERATLAREATRERAAREAAIEVEVNLALQEAQRWQEQAKWPEALSAAKRAEGLLAGGGSDDVRERVHQFRNDLDMMLRLEEFRAQRQQHSLGHEALNGAYASLFADYGIDVENLSPPEIAARIARRPATAVRVAGALDDWAQVLRDWGLRDRSRAPATWKRLLEAARLADPDPWRSQLRQLTGQGDLIALRKLADESDMAVLPVQSLQQMGNHLIFSGDGPACVEWLRKAHRQHPGDALISFDLAWHLSHLPSADLAEVLRFAEAGLAARPSPATYTFVGGILNRLGRHEEAVAVCRKAIELKPDFESAHNNLGIALARLGKVDEAIACYRKAIELKPEFAWAHNNFGEAFAAQGKLDEAVACYRKCIELSAKWSGAYHNLGNALAAQGELEGALACYAKALELDRKSTSAHTLLGDALRKLGKYPEAIVCYRQVVEDEPSNGFIINRLAWLLAVGPPNARDGAAALSLTRRARALERDNENFLNTQGAAQYRVGLFAEALDSLEQVTKASPNTFPWQPHNQLVQALCLHQLGKKEAALAAHEKGLDRLKHFGKDSLYWAEAQWLRMECEAMFKSDQEK